MLGKSARVNTVENSTQETNNDAISRTLNEMLERMSITDRNMAKLAEEIRGNASRNQHSRNTGDGRHMGENYGSRMEESQGGRIRNLQGYIEIILGKGISSHAGIIRVETGTVN